MSAAGRWSDLATWKGPTPYQGGPMAEQRGVVIHIAEGYYQGTLDWMVSPNNTEKVSAHFVAAKDGRAGQMVEVDVTAYTQVAGNGHWISIENEGFNPDALTGHQVEFAAQVLARAHREFGVPLQIATSPSGRGLGHHSMGGVNWGNHPDCPGPHIIAQKQAIVDRAAAIVNGESMPTADEIAAATENKVWHTKGSAKAGVTAGTVLGDVLDTADRIEAKVNSITPGDTVLSLTPDDAAVLAEALRPVIAQELAKLKLTATP